MYCSHCGTTLDIDDNFCPKCGNPICKNIISDKSQPYDWAIGFDTSPSKESVDKKSDRIKEVSSQKPVYIYSYNVPAIVLGTLLLIIGLYFGFSGLSVLNAIQRTMYSSSLKNSAQFTLVVGIFGIIFGLAILASFYRTKIKV